MTKKRIPVVFPSSSDPEFVTEDMRRFVERRFRDMVRVEHRNADEDDPMQGRLWKMDSAQIARQLELSEDIEKTWHRDHGREYADWHDRTLNGLFATLKAEIKAVVIRRAFEENPKEDCGRSSYLEKALRLFVPEYEERKSLKLNSLSSDPEAERFRQALADSAELRRLYAEICRESSDAS